MSPDDIDHITLDLFNLLVDNLGCVLDEDDDWDKLHAFMMDSFDKFCTRDRNYN